MVSLKVSLLNGKIHFIQRYLPSGRSPHIKLHLPYIQEISATIERRKRRGSKGLRGHIGRKFLPPPSLIGPDIGAVAFRYEEARPRRRRGVAWKLFTSSTSFSTSIVSSTLPSSYNTYTYTRDETALSARRTPFDLPIAGMVPSPTHADSKRHDRARKPRLQIQA